MPSQKQVLKKLEECMDPELSISIVDLGLIYKVAVDDSRVKVLMTLTTIGCPLDSFFVKDITEKVKTLKDVKDVLVEFTFDPPWTPSKMSQRSKELLGFVS